MYFGSILSLPGARSALVGLVAACVAAVGLAPARAAETVLYSFKGGSDGRGSFVGLISDAHGALYGTSSGGVTSGSCGQSGCGTVFKLTPPANGHTPWTKTVLYSFTGGTDGGFPGGRLVFDSHGALYGTTSTGGTGFYGTVFKLTPPVPPQTKWTFGLLYSFTGGSDGGQPNDGLILDKEGALYGTTLGGGTNPCFYQGTSGCGTVFKLTPPALGKTKWTETVLYSFRGGSGGSSPVAGLVFDKAGALYGATASGGTTVFCPSCGTVFKLTPPAPGHTQWTETVLHSFKGGSDGFSPVYGAGLVLDKAGALYGTTSAGGGFSPACGNTGCGTVFKLTPPAAGKTQWTETVLHGFTGGSDGNGPSGGVILDSFGAVYGTTNEGGTSPLCPFYDDLGCGTVFKLTPPAPQQTKWTETKLYSFTGGSDGAYPVGGLIVDPHGALYGTTAYEGVTTGNCDPDGCGTVFEIH